MKTYIINLEDAHDRKESMEFQAKRSGLRYELVPGIDGRKISANLLSILKKEHSYAVTPGEIGCSLSHLTVYKALTTSDDECALVLEDDVSLPEDISHFLNEIEQLIPKKTPSIYLLSKVNHYNGRTIMGLTNGHSVHDVYNAAFSHAYIINKPAAHILLDKLFPVWCVADQWQTFKEFGYIRLFAVHPEYISTNPVYESISTIGNRSDKKILEAKKIAWKTIYSRRSLKIKLIKAFNLLLHRPFQKIIKQ